MKKAKIAAMSIMLMVAGAVVAAAPANATYGGGGQSEKCYLAGEPRTELTWVKEVYKETAPAQEATPDTYAPLYDYSETRATGHFEATADGLHIWTEGSTSTDKVALYRYLGIASLSDISGTPFVDYTATTGITPGSQVVVDFDGDGTADGILINEPVYGDNAWLSNSAAQFVKDGAPHTGGGQGSEWYGTIQEWATAFPNAVPVAGGFSLGSGVHGDGIVHGVNIGGTNYSFVSVTPGSPAVPAQYGWVPTGRTGQGTELPTSNDKVRYVQTGTVEVPTWDRVDCDLAPVVTYGDWKSTEGNCETQADTSERTVFTTPWVKEKVGYKKYVLVPGETTESTERTAIAWTEDRIAEECTKPTPTPTPDKPTPSATPSAPAAPASFTPPQGGLPATGGGDLSPLVPLAGGALVALGAVVFWRKSILGMFRRLRGNQA